MRYTPKCGPFDPESMSQGRSFPTLKTTLLVTPTHSPRIEPTIFCGYNRVQLGRMPLEDACGLVRANLGDVSWIVRKDVGMRCGNHIKYLLSPKNQQKLSLPATRERVAGLINDIISFQFFLTPNILIMCQVYSDTESDLGNIIRRQNRLHEDMASFGEGGRILYKKDGSEYQRLIAMIRARSSTDDWSYILEILTTKGDLAEFVRKRVIDTYRRVYQGTSETIPTASRDSSR